MSGEYMRKLMKIVTEDKEYGGYAGPPPSAEQLALQREATEQVAEKINNIFEKHTNASKMPGAQNLPNMHERNYNLRTKKDERGSELTEAHFTMMAVYGPMSDGAQGAVNSKKNIDALVRKIVLPLREWGWIASLPTDAGNQSNEGKWYDKNTGNGGYIAKFHIYAPASIRKEELQEILRYIDSQA